MSELKFRRKAHTIYDTDGNTVFQGFVGEGDNKHPSINAAKRESRRLQLANGGLGRGSLKVS